MTIRLKPALFDLFQHLNLHCTAECCRWQAFDLSKRWLNRWCEFRDIETVNRAIDQIGEIESALACEDTEARVLIEGYFDPTVEELTTQLDRIRNSFIKFIQTSKIQPMRVTDAEER